MKNVFKKELVRVLGDKKMIFSMFILPAILVIGLYALMGQLMKSMTSDVEKHKSTVFIQNAPEVWGNLQSTVVFAENAEITYLKDGDDLTEIKDNILSGANDLLVVFEKDFMKKFRDYQNAGDAIPKVTVYCNPTENYSAAAGNKFMSMVLPDLQNLLLQERFHDLDKLNVFKMEEEPIQNEDKANGQMLAMMLPYLITFMLFSSAMGLCVDAVAGEKERGTMASMLITPVKRSGIIFGKIFALSVLSLISSAIYAGSMIIAMPSAFGGLEEAGVSMNVSFSPLQIVELFALMASLVFIYVAILCFLSALAKTMKEAQAYVMPVYMIVLVAGMMTMFNNGMKTPQINYAIPVYGTALSIQGIMTNELTLIQFGLSALSNVVCSLIFVALVVRAFNSEKIMLNA